ncbi:hypothetical protein C8Q70DRAFT_350093 [Cubamyces menziesii]|nr:hypothetical protein C8Q70DRAFT_350093 [Cubamyces menziesii]
MLWLVTALLAYPTSSTASDSIFSPSHRLRRVAPPICGRICRNVPPRLSRSPPLLYVHDERIKAARLASSAAERLLLLSRCYTTTMYKMVTIFVPQSFIAALNDLPRSPGYRQLSADLATTTSRIGKQQSRRDVLMVMTPKSGGGGIPSAFSPRTSSEARLVLRCPRPTHEPSLIHACAGKSPFDVSMRKAYLG